VIGYGIWKVVYSTIFDAASLLLTDSASSRGESPRTICADECGYAGMVTNRTAWGFFTASSLLRRSALFDKFLPCLRSLMRPPKTVRGLNAEC
jgi:hypothetical protein